MSGFYDKKCTKIVLVFGGPGPRWGSYDVPQKS